MSQRSNPNGTQAIELGEVNRTSAPVTRFTTKGVTKARVDSLLAGGHLVLRRGKRTVQTPLLDGDIPLWRAALWLRTALWLRAAPHEDGLDPHTEHHSEQTHSASVSDRPGDAPLSPEVLAAQLQVERALAARHASLPNGV